jgi:hypothetical protein
MLSAEHIWPFLQLSDLLETRQAWKVSRIPCDTCLASKEFAMQV